MNEDVLQAGAGLDRSEGAEGRAEAKGEGV